MYSCGTIVQRPVTPQAWLRLHAGAGAACLGMADWLFFGQSVGISFAVYVLFLALVAFCVNPVRARGSDVTIAMVVLVAGVIALVYDFNFLSFCVGVSAFLLYVHILSGVGRSSLLYVVSRFWRFAGIGFVLVVRDGIRVQRLWFCRRKTVAKRARYLQWIVPLVFGSVFVALFGAANPLIENMLRHVDLSAWWRHVSPSRMFFWFFVLGLVWPYLHIPSPRSGKAEAPKRRHAILSSMRPWMWIGQGTLLRSLLLFNAIFAVQTILDMAYLWGGLRLPDNLTYADYAHRGAYPLCCTALIAALFVLAAAPSLETTNPSRFLRPLLMIWVGQNLLLVVSALLRLDLYVAAYSLTGLRVAAFIWMVLVGLGLVLVSLKIYWRKSSSWLIGANALALGLTLYLCCFVNFALFVANYNVAHASSQGVEERNKLDEQYLVSLGSQAIPAMDAYIEAGRLKGRDMGKLESARAALANEFQAKQQGWRVFGLEAWSLHRYLAGKGESAASLHP